MSSQNQLVNFDIVEHENILSYAHPKEGVRGIWVSAALYAEFLGLKKQALIDRYGRDDVYPKPVFKTISRVLHFFVPMEQPPFSKEDAAVFRLEKSLSRNNRSICSYEIEELVINKKQAKDIRELNVKIKGFWATLDDYSELANIPRRSLVDKMDTGRMPIGTIVDRPNAPKPTRIFIPLIKSLFDTRDIEISILKKQNESLKREVAKLGDLPKWKEIKEFSSMLSTTEGLSRALIALSKVAPSDISKLKGFMAKVNKLFPD